MNKYCEVKVRKHVFVSFFFIGKFYDENCKLISTPLATNLKLSSSLSLKTEKEKTHMLGVQYASAIESIRYTMIYTHPNISHVIGVINKFIRSPIKNH